VCETPSYRHRGICIEGAISFEHVRNIIEWAPRVGFNAYFIQFREGYTFFDRWYSHTGNSHKPQESFSIEQARVLMAKAVGEIKKRDLLYHAVGHGWTCEPFGISGLGWDYKPEPLATGVSQWFAMVNGKRELWDGVPLNTNLCYSNPQVRHLIAQDILHYAEAHPEIDVLHFWLADGYNNNCECEECQKARPSDFYVMMLNEVDRLLSEHGLSTRIVFLIYFDLLWPPEQQHIHVSDRFNLMFDPITRSYSKTYSTSKALPDLPPYHRNRLAIPRTVEENVAFLKAWQRLFTGDSFDFDYHFMWDHFLDPGYVSVAKVLHQDLGLLHNIGLNGYVSCQVQRAFFPTGLGMMMMGWTLWDQSRDFDVMARDYMQAAFGPAWQECYTYLNKLSELFDPVYLRGEKSIPIEQAVQSFQQIPDVIEGFRSVTSINVMLENPCWAASWRYLQHHADITEALSRILVAWARGNEEECSQLWEVLKDMVWTREDILQNVFDVYFFIQVIERRLARKQKLGISI
jgi:hypothetical protein